MASARQTSRFGDSDPYEQFRDASRLPCVGNPYFSDHYTYQLNRLLVPLQCWAGFLIRVRNRLSLFTNRILISRVLYFLLNFRPAIHLAPETFPRNLLTPIELILREQNER
jgi:hypothetical protein